jgi:Zn finger protein HypA/HybF involved in hydrogenase expression
VHEIGLAAAVIEQLESLGAEYPGKRICCVRLSWGPLQPISEAALREAFEILAAERPFGSAQLEITVEPLRARCCGCGGEFSLDASPDACPHCRGGRFDLLPDKPLTLEQVELTDAPAGDTT